MSDTTEAGMATERRFAPAVSPCKIARFRHDVAPEKMNLIALDDIRKEGNLEPG